MKEMYENCGRNMKWMKFSSQWKVLNLNCVFWLPQRGSNPWPPRMHVTLFTGCSINWAIWYIRWCPLMSISGVDILHMHDVVNIYKKCKWEHFRNVKWMNMLLLNCLYIGEIIYSFHTQVLLLKTFGRPFSQSRGQKSENKQTRGCDDWVTNKFTSLLHRCCLG